MIWDGDLLEICFEASISASYPTEITPANWAFSIWGGLAWKACALASVFWIVASIVEACTVVVVERYTRNAPNVQLSGGL